jgi:prolipoprotein diacylglyceryltransferase
VIYIVSTLFSVLLGAICTVLVKVEYSSSSPSGAEAHLLITPSNLYRVAFAMVLFIIDWIAFGVAYPPSKPFTATWFDIVLLFLYFPALVALTASIMLSFCNDDKYCKPLALYHVLAGLTDVFWSLWLIQAQRTPYSTVSIIIFLFMYCTIRFGIPVLLVMSIKKVTSVKTEILLLFGALPKGFLFVMVPVTGMSLPTY